MNENYTAERMRLMFQFDRRDHEASIGFFMTSKTQIEEQLVELRGEIASLRQTDEEFLLECKVSLFESHLDPLDAPTKLRLIQVLETSHIPIVSFDFHHCALVKTHEERNEILCFIKHFQSRITSFKLHGVATNDFVLTWWIERTFTDASFLPSLQKFHISTAIIVNSAVAVRICEALIQTARTEIESVQFRPSHQPSVRDVMYLATLLSQAYENVLARQRKISHSIGQYAFTVLKPMLPYNRLDFCFITKDDDDGTLFTFDERILLDDTITSLGDVSLQYFTENYHLFEPDNVELFNLM